jgi:tetratricopeptide (TPR) repeat protein
MVAIAAQFAVQQVLAQASQALVPATYGADWERSQLARSTTDPGSCICGLVRMHQQRFEEAAQFFGKARKADPREAVLAFSHGTALRWLERPPRRWKVQGRHRPQTRLCRGLFRGQHNPAAAWPAERGGSRLASMADGASDHARGKLALADLLLATKRPQEAEPLLRSALQQLAPQEMRGTLHRSLGLALHRQGKDQQALEQLEKSASLSPDATTDAMRAEILQRLKRYDQAAVLSAGMVAREPENPAWHKFHNDLMYRLGDDDYLKSYDRALDGGPIALQGLFPGA